MQCLVIERCKWGVEHHLPHELTPPGERFSLFFILRGLDLRQGLALGL